MKEMIGYFSIDCKQTLAGTDADFKTKKDFQLLCGDVTGDSVRLTDQDDPGLMTIAEVYIMGHLILGKPLTLIIRLSDDCHLL